MADVVDIDHTIAVRVGVGGRAKASSIQPEATSFNLDQF
jgi:hypothetical protein